MFKQKFFIIILLLFLQQSIIYAQKFDFKGNYEFYASASQNKKITGSMKIRKSINPDFNLDIVYISKDKEQSIHFNLLIEKEKILFKNISYKQEKKANEESFLIYMNLLFDQLIPKIDFEPKKNKVYFFSTQKKCFQSKSYPCEYQGSNLFIKMFHSSFYFGEENKKRKEFTKNILFKKGKNSYLLDSVYLNYYALKNRPYKGNYNLTLKRVGSSTSFPKSNLLKVIEDKNHDKIKQSKIGESLPFILNNKYSINILMEMKQSQEYIDKIKKIYKLKSKEIIDKQAEIKAYLDNLKTENITEMKYTLFCEAKSLGVWNFILTRKDENKEDIEFNISLNNKRLSYNIENDNKEDKEIAKLIKDYIFGNLIPLSLKVPKENNRYETLKFSNTSFIIEKLKSSNKENAIEVSGNYIFKPISTNNKMPQMDIKNDYNAIFKIIDNTAKLIKVKSTSFIGTGDGTKQTVTIILE